MTTLICECGTTWAEGPTRDIKKEVCRHCLTAQVTVLKSRLTKEDADWDAAHKKAVGMVDSLRATIQAMTETAAEQSRVHAEMHNTIQALNEENANLARLLRRCENPD